MTTRTPEISISVVQETKTELDSDAGLVLAALDKELDAREEAASVAAKQRLEEHLEAAKETSGGRGYDFEAIVDVGHRKRQGLGGSAVRGAFGMAPRPYGMPSLRGRFDYNNPYIGNPSALRY